MCVCDAIHSPISHILPISCIIKLHYLKLYHAPGGLMLGGIMVRWMNQVVLPPLGVVPIQDLPVALDQGTMGVVMTKVMII